MAQRASTQLADSERAGSLTTDSKRNRQFTAQDNDLMVYLKEVKGLGWGEIMQEFPDRTKGVLNTHYCRKIKGNNWMLNRLTLELPPKYAAEAEVLWPAFRKRLGLQHSPSATVPLRHEGTPNDIQDQTFLPQPARPGGRPRKEATTAISLSKTYPSAVYNSSSDYDSAPRQGPARPQRSVASVDYTWPRRRRRPQTAEDFDEDIVIEKAETPDLEHLHGSLAVEDDVVLPVDEPMDLVFDLEDARLAVTGGIVPYLSFSQRKVIQDGSLEGEWDQIASRGWQGTVLHVDFSREEMETVEDSLQQIVGDACQRSGNIRKRLRRTLFNLPEPKLVRLSQAVRRKLQSRDVSSIDAFIQDAAAGKLSVSPHIQRIGAARPKRTWSSSGRTSTSSLLRHREFGLQARRGWSAASRPLSYSFRNNVYDTLGPTLSYTGASGDVTTVAWSPDGLNFAAGAVCVTDRDSMQYNRPNNLLYGDVVKQTIHELAEHRRERKRPESGPNSSEEMHVSQDPYLYYTVSSVAFSADGDWMFAAGYDHTVTVWHTRDRGSGERFQPKLFKALEHKAKVDIIAVSQHNTLATAANRWEKAIKVCTVEGNFSPTTFSSTKGHQRPDLKILPTALKFEPTYGRLLLAGFGANRSEDRLDTTGDICLWDVQTQQEIMVYGSTANIFDVAWAPNRALTSVFAVGCVASGNVNRGTRSLVRLYDGRGFEKRTKIMEAECPALDMNDVVFCPYDENLIAAGCTSGHTYVWDLRKPDQWLYRLQHGKSLMPLDEGVSREVVDTGVRFLSWGDNATRLYTGSSDGVVKVWDVARAHQDVFVRDLVTLNSGIMSGAFSPDNSRLLLGEVDGSVNVLEVGNNDRSVRDMEKMTYVPYKEDVNEAVLAEHGTEPAAQLLASGEMVNVPFGGFPVRQAVQGPNYRGPFDTSADASYLRSQARKFQLGLAETSQSCDVPSCGNTSILRMTAEERGDSGRSVDRIPDELRKLWSITESEQAAFHGKSKCQNPACGRPARPKVAFGSEAQKQLCERCSFGCFRCGGLCRILNPGTDDKVVCQSCLEAWEIGALGYEAIDDDVLAATTLELPVPQLSRWKRAVEREKERDERKGTSWGDELNALSDYYFGLTVQEEEDDY
ncbi:WD40 repeat-like protein [Westerdykella ornata]|uniref:WD40 repeat-like protein n=1 Tax=Westerdykella ornata TaxID=318751 RepID=A0A6A6J482_WESOR|nr:WD40 repeat-like protein [Westerdykella ornata]KAF2271381.1 WD40 repeat-like protein [Westerdykella ornata]